MNILYLIKKVKIINSIHKINFVFTQFSNIKKHIVLNRYINLYMFVIVFHNGEGQYLYLNNGINNR